MTHDPRGEAGPRRDLIVEAYVRALDRRDIDALAGILAEAEVDPELDRLLGDVDTVMHAEDGLPTHDEQGRTVRRLLLRHLPSAFAEPETGPPAVGDVAARLRAEHAAGRQLLPPGDVEANDRLLGDRTIIRGSLTAPVVRRLAATLPVQASDRYWELFRRAAVALAMARQQGAAHLAAARSRTARRRSRQDVSEKGE